MATCLFGPLSLTLTNLFNNLPNWFGGPCLSLCSSGLGRLDAVTSIGASGLYDMKKIGEWATQSRLDPNDPKNASIMQLLKVGSRI